VVAGRNPGGQWSTEFDVPDMLSAAVADDPVVVADTATSARLEIVRGYMYLTWDCVAP
jgi:hypothetical protein